MFEYVHDLGLVFGSAVPRRAATRALTWHHTASEASTRAIHDHYRSIGNRGFPYNFHVLLDGTVEMGCGLDGWGAHAGRKTEKKHLPEYATATWNNSETVGIAAQGMYHPGAANSRMIMPSAQFDSLVLLSRDIIAHYGTVQAAYGHREMPATATVCPGAFFPLAELRAAAFAAETVPAPVIPPPFQMIRYLRQTSPLQRGEDVKWLQMQLNLFGYDLVVDGVFGPKTHAAVVAFQRAHGLTVDGVVGPQTHVALVAAVKAITPTIRRGGKGDAAKLLQTLLLARGYKLPIGGADGIFGAETEAAVRAFQAANGLIVDGIVGPQTWGALLA